MTRLLFLILGGLILVAPQTALAEGGAPSPVPQTGQTQCWDDSGTLISCAGTGQDGEYQTGVKVGPRFIDNDDGTVTDNLTGLIWLRNADCFGIRNWIGALYAVNGLADGACGLEDGSVAGDWRVPNVRELHSLLDFDEWLPILPEVHPFFGEQAAHYWSSTTRVVEPSIAWNVHLGVGHVGGLDKDNAYLHVWPIRDGQSGSLVDLDITPGSHPDSVTLYGRGGPASPGLVEASDAPPAPLPKTGQSVSYYTGDDGAYQVGVSVDPRFTDNNDGTVTDNLTGLIWLQDATCIWANWTDALSAVSGLADGACSLTDGSLAGDWRVPNVRELYSLVDYGQWSPALPEGHPFPAVNWDNWTSTTRADDPDDAWVVKFYPGVVFKDSKINALFAWPVRDGQTGISLDLDIKPYSETNPINPRSRGVIPIALFGSDDFSVHDVDVTTLAFGPAGATPKHDLTDEWTFNGHVQDVNLDGFMDLMTHFKTQDTGIVCGDTEASLAGSLLDGTPFAGSGTFTTVGCNFDKRPHGMTSRYTERIQRTQPTANREDQQQLCDLPETQRER